MYINCGAAVLSIHEGEPSVRIIEKYPVVFEHLIASEARHAGRMLSSETVVINPDRLILTLQNFPTEIETYRIGGICLVTGT